MTISRQKSGGARQRIWDVLRAGQPVQISDIAHRGETSEISVRAYLNALEARGYIEFQHLGYVARGPVRTAQLVRNTGPRCPSWSVHTNQFRDWNIDQPMSGADLGGEIAASGLSIRGWLVKHGLPPSEQTRVRQMINGQRPVSQKIANMAKII